MFYRHLVRGETFADGDTFRGRIPIIACVERRLYRVDTRNFGPIAIFDGTGHNGFYGIRRKFGIRLDVEFHWENGPPHGTANPWEELDETLPEEIEFKTSMPTVCKACKVPVEWRSNTTSTREGPAPGKWFHLADTECTEDLLPVSYENRLLMEWLKSMELKYWWPVGEQPEWLNPPPDSEP